MIEDHKAFERLADALADDILQADEAEVLASHAGRGSHVVADSLRQAIRRGAARSEEDRDIPGDLVRRLTMRPHREEKP